jgi:hypothetical protein
MFWRCSLASKDPSDLAHSPLSQFALDTLARHASSASPSEDKEKDKEPERFGVGGKYGLIDTVLDGVSVEVQRINVNLVAPDFVVNVALHSFCLFSPATDWGTPQTLKDTRIKNKAARTITLFKQASIHRIDIEITTKAQGEVRVRACRRETDWMAVFRAPRTAVGMGR